MITVSPCKTEAEFAVAGDLIAELGFWDSAETKKLGFSEKDVLDFYYTKDGVLPDTNALGSGLTLLGRIGADVGGCIAYRRLNPEICELKRLYVRPDFRRTGLGRTLVSCLISHARAADYKIMRLETVSFMERAIDLYEEMGFVRRAPYYDIPNIFLPITIFMEKNLERSDVAARQDE